MDRDKYNTCMRPHMTGKGKTKEERQAAMCIGAKLCTGKASNEEEARKICSQPKEGKPKSKKVKHETVKCGPIRAILLTEDNCKACDYMRQRIKGSLAAGEIEVVNATKDPGKAESLMKEYKARTPSILVLSSAGELIARG